MAPRLAYEISPSLNGPSTFARPFRFGAITITATPQAFVLVEIEVEGKGRAVGASLPSCWCRNGSTSGRSFRLRRPSMGCAIRC